MTPFHNYYFFEAIFAESTSTGDEIVESELFASTFEAFHFDDGDDDRDILYLGG